MFDFSHLMTGLQASLQPLTLAVLFAGTLVGIIVGILPGLGPMVGMVILLPISFVLDPSQALILLLGVFCGGYFGGGIPAVLIRTPGVPASLVTSFDGFPLTQKGQSQKALSGVIMGSFSGGIISVVLLILTAPALAHLALNFGPSEYFFATLFGVLLVVLSNMKQLVPAIILMCLGLWISSIGVDPSTYTQRYTMGSLVLFNGLPVASICLGLFGIGQALRLAEKAILTEGKIELSRSTLDLSMIGQTFRHWKTMICSGIVGTLVGILPGTGAILASFLGYETARKLSPEPEKFGTGMVEGCIGAEAANNAVPAGTMVPLLTLGIPGDGTSAVLLTVFTVNGIFPGPLLLIKEPALINTLYISLFFINIFAMIMLIFCLRPFAMIVRIPNSILAATVGFLSLIGIYSMNSNWLDIAVSLGFGVAGYYLLNFRWPLINLVMGVVLGPIMEMRLREALTISDGNIMFFLERPITLGIIAACFALVAYRFLMKKKA